MKIVNRIEFLKLPSNTVFSTYQSDSFGDISIKGDTIGSNDFGVQYLNDSIDYHSGNEFYDILSNAQKTGESINMDFYCLSRDGLFDNEQLFAVWDEADVKALIVRLSETLKS